MRKVGDHPQYQRHREQQCRRGKLHQPNPVRSERDPADALVEPRRGGRSESSIATDVQERERETPYKEGEAAHHERIHLVVPVGSDLRRDEQDDRGYEAAEDSDQKHVQNEGPISRFTLRL